MTLNQIRNIVAVAERGSLRSAARFLGVTQPAITRSIRELEHELGVPLFERRVSLPLVAMADPWLIAACVAGLLCVWPGKVAMRTAARLVVAAISLFLVFKSVMLATAPFDWQPISLREAGFSDDLEARLDSGTELTVDPVDGS